MASLITTNTSVKYFNIWDTSRPECSHSGFDTSIPHYVESIERQSYKTDAVQGDHVLPLPYLRYGVESKPIPFSMARPFKNKTYWLGSGCYGKKRLRYYGDFRHNEGLYNGAFVTGGYPRVSLETIGAATNEALNRLVSQKLDLSESLADVQRTGRMMIQRLMDIASALYLARQWLKGRKLDPYPNLPGSPLSPTARRRSRRRAKDSAIRKKWTRVASKLGVSLPTGFVKRQRRRTWADGWLELKFGWLQLMNDVHDGYNLITDEISEGKALIQVQATKHETTRPLMDNLRYSIVDGHIKALCKVGLTVEPDNWDWVRQQQLGIANPALIAWNLTTLSFVADWFIQVGSFLNALGAPVGLQFKHGFRTTFAKSDITVQDNGTYWTDFGSTGDLPRWRANAFSVWRIQLGSFPIPRIQYKLNLNIGKLVTAVALGSQR